MSRTIKIISEVAEEGGAFVALTDNGKVRIGYRNMSYVESDSAAFADLANTAASMGEDELEDAVSDALRAA